MKRVLLVVLTCLICLLLSGCHISTWFQDDIPLDEDFNVAVYPEKLSYQVDEPIYLVTELQLLAEKKINILHGAPLIVTNIYDDNNKLLTEANVIGMVGIQHRFKGKSAYNPALKRSESLYQLQSLDPGTYTIKGTAYFSVVDKQTNRTKFKLTSAPVTFTVYE